MYSTKKELQELSAKIDSNRKDLQSIYKKLLKLEYYFGRTDTKFNPIKEPETFIKLQKDCQGSFKSVKLSEIVGKEFWTPTKTANILAYYKVVEVLPRQRKLALQTMGDHDIDINRFYPIDFSSYYVISYTKFVKDFYWRDKTNISLILDECIK